MLGSFGEILAIALAVAAVSTTIAKSSLFTKMREWMLDHFMFLGKLMSCSYCTSHWVAFFFVAIYRPKLIELWWGIDFVLTAFAVIAIATVIIGVMVKLTPFGSNAEDEDEDEEDYPATIPHRGNAGNM
jgi:Protein of unknown function (DUF1360)